MYTQCNSYLTLPIYTHSIVYTYCDELETIQESTLSVIIIALFIFLHILSTVIIQKVSLELFKCRYYVYCLRVFLVFWQFFLLVGNENDVIIKWNISLFVVVKLLCCIELHRVPIWAFRLKSKGNVSVEVSVFQSKNNTTKIDL